MIDFSSFKLSNSFISKYQGKQPDWGELGYITFKRTYARRLPGGGTEEWVDPLDRDWETKLLLSLKLEKSIILSTF